MEKTIQGEGSPSKCSTCARPRSGIHIEIHITEHIKFRNEPTI